MDMFAFMEAVANVAADATLPYFRTRLAVDNKDTGGFDPVTEADRAAERAIRALIGEHFPADGIHGEEYGLERPDAPRRWVIYNGSNDASRVPPEWHGWLHRTVVEPPTVVAPQVKPWQKPHLPNLTGSAQAYRPPGHTLKGGHRAKGTGDYEPWVPN
ncbi:MAG: hypothetical protein HC779_05890 [Phyllobacteriaceae bacterium]|nr:hypothetical protein [Phyllobacteriaceae bacterium]